MTQEDQFLVPSAADMFLSGMMEPGIGLERKLRHLGMNAANTGCTLTTCPSRAKRFARVVSCPSAQAHWADRFIVHILQWGK